MTLASSITTKVAAAHNFILEYSATQDSTARTSTITANLYWQSTSTSGSVYSSSTKNYTIKIGSYSSSGTFSAALSGVQKKLIGSFTKTIPHDSTGNLSLTMSYTAALNITLSGVSKGTYTDSKTFTLDPIAGSASLTSIPDRWTFDNPLPVSWAKSTSTDVVNLKVYVEGVANDESQVLIATRTGLTGTSTAVELTQTEKNDLIDQRYVSNGSYWVELTTFDSTGAQKGGASTIMKVIELPERSTIAKDGTLPAYNLGQTYTVVQDGPQVWTMAVSVHDATTDELLTTIPDFNGSTQWTPPRSLIAAGETTRAVNFKIYSKYNDKIIRNGSVDKPTTFHFTARPPIWSGATPTITDTNTAITALTGSNSIYVQALSNLRVNIPVGAVVAQDGATISSFRVYKGSTLVGAYTPSTTQINLGVWDVAGNQSIKIYAIDNYGSSTVKELPIVLIPYKTPVITATNLARLNGYEGTITGLVNGTYAPIMVNGVSKNTLSSVVLSYRKSTDASYTTVGNYNITHTANQGTFTTNSQTIPSLTEADTYEVKVVATDRLGNSYTLNKTIAAGVPLVYFDKKNSSVGFGKFPTTAKSIETDFTIRSTSIVNTGEISTGSINATGTIRTSGALYSTGGKLWIGNTAEINWDATNARLKTTHTLYDNNDKSYWTGSNLEIQSGFVMTSNEANVVKQVDVVFPKPFTSVPNVVATAAVQATQNVLGLTVSNITTTGFTMFYLRKTAVSTNANQLNWIATAKV